MSYFVNEIKYIKEALPTTHEILRLLANGHTHEEIRKELFLSAPSLRGKLEYATYKYGCRTSRQLIAKAVSDGVVEVIDA